MYQLSPLDPDERDPRETGYCSWYSLERLRRLGIPTRVSAILSEQQAVSFEAALLRDRVVDALVREAVARA